MARARQAPQEAAKPDRMPLTAAMLPRDGEVWRLRRKSTSPWASGTRQAKVMAVGATTVFLDAGDGDTANIPIRELLDEWMRCG